MPYWRYHTCKYCREEFHLLTEQDIKYCSNKCRQAAYRARKKRVTSDQVSRNASGCIGRGKG